MKRLLPLAFAGVAAIAVGTVWFLFLSPELEPAPVAQTKPGVPPIAWEPKELVVTLSPGETKTVTATATIQSAIPGTMIEVVPALVPYVTVTPTSLPALPTGAEQSFDLMFDVPEGTPFGTIDGTLHLRAGTSTVARPWGIEVNVWPRASIPDLEGNTALTLSYPPFMNVTMHSASPAGQVFVFAEPSGVGFLLEVHRLMLSVGSISTWADTQTWPFPEPWQDHFEVRRIGGLDALVDPVAGGVIFGFDNTVYVLQNGLGREDRELLDSSVLEPIVDSIKVH